MKINFFYFTAIVQLNNFDPVIVESLHIDRIPPIEYYKESSTARSHLIDYFVSQLNVIFREIEMNNKGIFTLDDFELEKGWPSLYAQVREV